MGWLPRAAGSAVLLPVAGVALGLACAALVATASAPDAAAAPAARDDRAGQKTGRQALKRPKLGALAGAGPAAAARRLRVVRPRAGARMSGRTRIVVASPRMTGVRRVDVKVGGRLVARLRPVGGVFTGAGGWLDARALRRGGTELMVLVHRVRSRSIVRRPVAVVAAAPAVGVVAPRKDATPLATTPKARTPAPPTAPTPPAPPPADTAGPRLAITSPAAGADVSGTRAIAADADDPSGVASVRFSVAGTTIGTDTRAPYSVSWNTAATANGTRQITVVATDARGNTSTATRSVDVVNAAPPPTAPPPTDPLPTAPPPTTPPPGDALAGTLSWTGDFETDSLSQWSGVQRVATDRVQVVSAPAAQGSRAARIEVRHGDYWQGSGGNRAELVRHTDERQGDERWYSWSTMFAPGYPSTTTGWQIFTQWHASAGGTQPTLVFYASGEKIGFKTVESDASFKSKPSVVHWTGAIARGEWHTFRLHVKWSDDPATGWVELWHNGVQVVQRTPVAGRIPGLDLYLKQGLYRSDQIVPTGVLYHDGMRMSSVN